MFGRASKLPQGIYYSIFVPKIFRTMKKAAWISIGFLLFIIGFSAVVLSLVGIKFSYLTWLDAPGALFGFLMKIFMVIGGIVIVYMTVIDWRAEE